MQLASRLAAEFGASIRKRGMDYFRRGWVKVHVGSPTEVGAIVRGSERYAVTLKWTGEELAVLCSCAYFMDREDPCKHLWATVLAADAKGYLDEARAARNVYLDTETLVDELPENDFKRTILPPSGKEGPFELAPPRPPLWKKQLSRVAELAAVPQKDVASKPRETQVIYVIDVAKSKTRQGIVLTLASREPRKQGGWKYNPRSYMVMRSRIASVPLAEDREILSMLLGGGGYSPYGYSSYDPYDRTVDTFSLDFSLARKALPAVLQTGRCVLPFSDDAAEPAQLQWDDGEPWRFALDIEGSEVEGWKVVGAFRRADRRMDVAEPVLAIPGGLLVTKHSVALLDADRDMPWVSALREHGAIAVTEQEREEFLSSLLASPSLPSVDLPEQWQYEEVTVSPRPCLTVSKPKYSSGSDRLQAKLTFEYEALPALAEAKGTGLYDAATRRFLRRDLDREKAATGQLLELGLRAPGTGWQSESAWGLSPAKLPRIARALAETGWQVMAEGKVFRQPGKSSVSVVSGVDWFELHGTVDYGEASASLPQLLSALKRGENMVILSDGSYGLLPEEWLRRFGHVAAMGEVEGQHFQFRRSQAGLLDALLSAQPSVDCDEQFNRVREELERFQSVGPAEQPEGFVGRLREYQREGLGWMHFLRQFNFGGCLADDMGVGKTAQVLALLETRRELRVKGEIDAPSLVVLPKSLIFNWKQEIARFTPQMRVLDYTGIMRSKEDFAACDVMLTTYGTLRRDAVYFSEQVFDYLILDEAQAIKNAKTASAKAVRLLRGNHRLAMSGTPVENHLGELWSLFEFLNPGMLGAATVFQLGAKDMRNPDDESRKLLAKALRPFLLRRTKEQVAKELPAKVEQTLFCELEPKQRALYNELREHYRASLLNKIEKSGIAKSKIQVLEALLRLRQAACHPGLVDRTRATDPSAKLDVLLDQLRAVMEEGHKALVFSQFTALLDLVGRKLQADEIAYEYLDGKTADRQTPVERFQNDPASRLFLISLKAGGLGLNLTAADYVFILDPWWNPAVEAQAVDRAHRIGQVRQVFAYRLIARDTVEEKILQLQENKRNIADAILGEDNSLIRDLDREDIELLLS